MALAIVFALPDVVETRTLAMPEPGPGEIRLRTLYSLVSPGTELRSLAGQQAGLTDAFPFIPGYSIIGEAEDGRRFFSSGTQQAPIARGWGGHVSEVITREADAIPLPDGIDPKEALFAKMWGIAWRGFVVSGYEPGRSVTLVGLGLVGQLSARLFHAAGADVLAVDPEPTRRARAPVPSVGSMAEALERRPDGADIVVDATGVGPVLAEGLKLLRDLPWQGPGEGGVYVVQGSYAQGPPVPYDDLFRKEARLVFPRDHRRTDTVELLDRVAAGELSAVDLAGPVQSPQDAPALYAELKKRGARVTAMFDWAEIGKK